MPKTDINQLLGAHHRATANRYITPLVAAGVIRVVQPTGADGRQRVLELTPKGRQFIIDEAEAVRHRMSERRPPAINSRQGAHLPTEYEEVQKKTAREEEAEYTESLKKSVSAAEAVHIYANRAAVRVRLGHYDAARADCDRAIQFEPNHFIARTTRAAINEHQGYWSAVVDDLTPVVDRRNRETDRTNLYEWRARALEQLGRYREALEDLKLVKKELPLKEKTPERALLDAQIGRIQKKMRGPVRV